MWLTYVAVEAEPGVAAITAVRAAIGQASLPVVLIGPHVIVGLRDDHSCFVGLVTASVVLLISVHCLIVLLN